MYTSAYNFAFSRMNLRVSSLSVARLLFLRTRGLYHQYTMLCQSLYAGTLVLLSAFCCFPSVIISAPPEVLELTRE
jgi:hypothetical protein